MSKKTAGCDGRNLYFFLVLLFSVAFFLFTTIFPQPSVAANFSIESTNPSNMQRDVPTDMPITITFDKPIDQNILDPQIVPEDGHSRGYPLFFEVNLFKSPHGILTHVNQEDYDINPNSIDPDKLKYSQISIVPQSTLDLDPNSEYTYSIHVHYSENAQDPNNEVYFFTFTTNIAPTVLSAQVEENALSEDPNVAIRITFSEPMDPNSFSAMIDSYLPIPRRAYSWENNNEVVILGLEESFNYIEIVEAYDCAGNSLRHLPYMLNFSAAPSIVSVFPDESMATFEKIDLIAIDFDQPMKTALVEDSFYLTSDSNQEIAIDPNDFKWYENNTKMIFYPDPDAFYYERVYRYGLREPHTILSLDNQPLQDTDTSWSFYSGAKPFWSEEPFDKPLPGNYISHLLLDDQGNYWMGVADSTASKTKWKGLSYVAGHNVTTYTAFDNPTAINDPNAKNVLVSNKIVAMDFDSKGRLWIATNANLGSYGGVSMRDELGKWYAFQYDAGNPNGFADNNVNALMIDQDDRIWLATDKGICLGKQNGTEWVWKTYNLSNMNIDGAILAWSSFNSIVENKKKGSIVFGAGESIGNIILLNTNRGPDDPNAWECLIDNSHAINEGLFSISSLYLFDPDNKKYWIGTTNRGLIEYVRNPSNYKQRDEVISKNDAVSRIIYDAHSSKIWMIVQNQSGPYRLVSYNTSFSGWHTYTLSSEFEDLKINDIVFDGSGNIWLGTDQGRIKCDIEPSYIVASSTVPQDQRVDVPLSSNIRITFTEAMDRDSVEKAFSISPGVNGSFSWNLVKTEVTFYPYSDLSPFTAYEVIIDTNAKDAAHHALYPSYTFNFTTEGLAVPIKDQYPGANSRDVSVTSRIIIEFNEPMGNKKKYIEDTFCLRSSSSGCIEGNTFLWENNDTKLSVIPPPVSLVYGKEYTVQLGTNTEDWFHFTTIASPFYTFKPPITSSNANGDLAASHITAMTFDATGRLWIAGRPIDTTERAGISFYNDENSIWSSYTSEDVYDTWLDYSIVNKMLFDRDGRLWMAMEPDSQHLSNIYAGGVACFHNGVWALYQPSYNQQFPSNSVNDILVSTDVTDTNRWVWIATDDGLGLAHYNKIYDTWIWSTYDAERINVLPEGERFTAICRASNGDMWFGTDAGNLVMFDGTLGPDDLSAWRLDTILSSHNKAINSIAFDRNGDLWIGLAEDPDVIGRGLIRYNPDFGGSSYEEYGYDNTNTVLPDAGVLDVAITEQGIIGVLSANNRVSVFDPSASAGARWTSCFVPIQQPDATVTTFAYSDNEVWIGTDNGLLLRDTIHQEIDTIPPEIESIFPHKDATEVALTTAIEIRFSEPMDKAATEGAFILYSTEDFTTDSLISGINFIWQDENRKLICKPPQLMSNTKYTVLISTDAKDLAGNSIDKLEEISFTTSSADAPLVVAEASPRGFLNTAIDFENMEIMIRFNKEMNPIATEQAITIFPPVKSSIKWSADNTTMTLEVENLRYGQVYLVTISEDAEDAQGNSIAEASEFSFTTYAKEEYRKLEGEGCFIGMLNENI
ncbi:MAG: Ig-like domain-containing protein [bacterium]